MLQAFGFFRTEVKKSVLRMGSLHFWLHGQASIALALITIVMTVNHYYSQPMECNSAELPTIESRFLSEYCWLKTNHKLGKMHWHELRTDEDNIYIRYYHWGALLFLMQAVAFYLVSRMWKFYEGGEIEAITKDLKYPVFDKEGTIVTINAIYKEEMAKYEEGNEQGCSEVGYTNIDRKVKHLCDFIISQQARYKNYMSVFCLFEVINALHAPAWIAFIDDVFLNNKFCDVRNYDRLFPTKVECEYENSMKNMTIVSTECLLTQNLLNEKIFYFIWGMYVGLTCFGFITLVYRLCRIITIKKDRGWLYPRFLYPAAWKIVTEKSYFAQTASFWLLVMRVSDFTHFYYMETILNTLDERISLQKSVNNDNFKQIARTDFLPNKNAESVEECG